MLKKLIIVLIILLAIGLGVYIWQGERNVKIPEGWQVYSNELLGFQLAYPEDYKIDESGGHSPLANPEVRGNIRIDPKVPGPDTPNLEILVIDVSEFSSLQDYMDKKYRDGFIPVGQVKIQNRDYEILRLGNWDSFYVFLENQDYVFAVNSPFGEELMKEILSTFKFLE